MSPSAKCGCSSSTVCPCVLSAGSNITISGTGQAGDPWVVNANATPVTVTDTPTVDLTLTGVDITADVKLEPVGNLITTTANGLLLNCAAVQTCDIPQILHVLDTATVDLTLTGDGSPGSPWVLMADAPGCDCSAIVTTADTSSVDLSVGTAPLTANVIRDPAATNIMTIGAAGVLVDLTIGCGLSGEGTAASPLIVQTAGAPTVTSGCGGKVYCRTATGQLEVDPEKFVLVQHFTQPITGGGNTAIPLEDFISVADGGNGTVHSFPVDNVLHPLGVTGDLVITNPSACRSMQLEVEYGLSHYALRVDGPGRTNVQVTAALSAAGAGGVAFGTQIGNAHNQNFSNNLAGFTGGSSMDILWDTGTTYPLNLPAASLVLAPSGSVTFTITGQMKVPNFAANGENSSLTAEAFVRVWGWSI